MRWRLVSLASSRAISRHGRQGSGLGMADMRPRFYNGGGGLQAENYERVEDETASRGGLNRRLIAAAISSLISSGSRDSA